MSSWRDGARRWVLMGGTVLIGAGATAQVIAQVIAQVTAQVAAQVTAQVVAQVAAQNERYPGLGRTATTKELAAWDIDVRPDFKGLPKGSGTVAQGMAVWDSRCESCHGVFGESNQVFNPLVGGTTVDDIKTGRVARLNDAAYPARTTLMKLSSLSTLWDYIHRAMPWASPKSLSADEVYAVTAYILHLADVLPENFTLSDQNMAEVQQRLPNRHGMSRAHGLWPGARPAALRPDVRAVACMKGCAAVPQVASVFPDSARDSHGELSAQNRLVGAQVGLKSSRPALSAPPVAPPASVGSSAGAMTLARQHGCLACHSLDARLLGPSFQDVAKKYAGRADGVAELAGKIKAGGAGVWGAIPMPPQAVSPDHAKAIALWLLNGAKP